MGVGATGVLGGGEAQALAAAHANSPGFKIVRKSATYITDFQSAAFCAVAPPVPRDRFLGPYPDPSRNLPPLGAARRGVGSGRWRTAASPCSSARRCASSGTMCYRIRDVLAHRRPKGHPSAAPHPRRRVRGEEARAAGRPGAVPPLLSLGAAVRLGVQFDVGTALREGRKGAAGGVERHQGGSIALPGPALAVATCVCGFSVRV